MTAQSTFRSTAAQSAFDRLDRAATAVMLAAGWSAVVAGELLTLPESAAAALAIAALWLFARTARSVRLLRVLATLLMIAATLLRTGVSFFVALAVFAVATVAAMASAEVAAAARRRDTVVRPVPERTGRRLLALATGLTTASVVIALMIFLLAPRAARAVFRHVTPLRSRVTVFAGTVELGRYGEIKRRSRPVLHVRTFTGDGRLPLLKWRGAVLGAFDGERWTPFPEPGVAAYPEQGLIQLVSNDQRWRFGRRVSYEVTIDGLAGETLFVAGIPEFVQMPSGFVRRLSTGALRADGPVFDGLRYGVYSFLEDAAAAPAPPQSLDWEARQRYLELPKLDPRIGALADQLRSPAAIERYLRTKLTYSLDPIDERPADPLAHFLFEKRAGHCEYFASAMAVMLRSRGVPSRVVTGFQGGVWNPHSQRLVLRTSDAHAWVEAWFDGLGWVTFDPTPADLGEAETMWTRAALWLDAIDTAWRDWVVGYSTEQQLALVGRLGQVRVSLDWPSAAWLQARWLMIAAAAMSIAAVWLAVRRWRWRRKPTAQSEAGTLYLQFLERLRRRGFEKPAWMTPLEFTEHLPDAVWAAAARRLTSHYYAARFRGDVQALASLREELKRMPSQ